MPKRPTFKPLPTPQGWMISIPPSMSGTGKRKKRYFEKEREAMKFAASLKSDYHAGLRGGTISPHLANMAAIAESMLEPLGLTILEAAREVVRLHQGHSTETFKERYERFMDAQERHWRNRYALDMAKIPRWVGKEFMSLRVATIDDASIDKALGENGAKADSTIQARRMRVKSVLNAKGKKKRIITFSLLTFRQCGQMLRAAYTAEERRAVALLLFAGIRPDADGGEITRLDWSTFTADHIYLPEDVSKTGTDRHIPITPRLRRLIKGRPQSGSVVPPRWKIAYQRIRKAAGLSIEQDITRHTFASHFLAAYGEDATKQAMGHTKGSDTLFRKYRRAVIKDDGLKYFSDGAKG